MEFFIMTITAINTAAAVPSSTHVTQFRDLAHCEQVAAEVVQDILAKEKTVLWANATCVKAPRFTPGAFVDDTPIKHNPRTGSVS